MKDAEVNAMTPWEYAQYLQDRYATVESFQTEMCDVLTATLLGSLPDEHRKSLQDVPIIVLPIGQVNAMCIKVPGGGSVVAINFGLMSYFTFLNKLVLCRLNKYGFEPTLDLRASAEMGNTTTVQLLLNNRVNFPRWPVSPKRSLIASALGSAQVAFIVGHELAHLLLGHLESNRDTATFALKGLDINTASYRKHHELEFASDRRAAEIAIQYFTRAYDPLFGSNEPAYAQAGVDMVFSYFEYIYSIMTLMTGEEPQYDTHPPSTLRRQKLREFMWNKMPETSRELATSVEAIMNSFKSSFKSSKRDV